MRKLLQREFAGFITLALFLIYLAFAAPSFYSLGNLRDIALANVSVLLISTGMTLVIVVAEIDISVGSLFAICGVCGGLLARGGLPIWMLPFAGIAIGSALGAANGGLVSFVKAPSIVVTLATMVAWREALNWATGGAWVENLPANFQWFGLGQAAGEAVLFSATAVLFLAILWASHNLPAFRSIYATGSDAEAARLAGINTKLVVFAAFVLVGALTGLASVLNAVRFSDVPANAGIGLELQSIAAVVVGGTPITGGRGRLMGTLIGVALLGIIGPALTYLQLSPYWEKAIQGGIILVTVLFDALASRAEKRPALA
ncbi:MAG TPA: ABC transporter permease [Bryobacteraceae bacterium]|nr:ABC transporter permease [Bryobacteraceae bacterium]